MISSWWKRYPDVSGSLILLGLTLLLGISRYPGFTQPEKILPDDNDSLLITYIVRQTQLNLLDPDKARYWGSFFAPYRDTLRYSEPFTTTALLTLPLTAGSPLKVYNLGLLIGLLLTSFWTYLLLVRLRVPRAVALVTTLAFNFSGVHWHYLAHLQMFNLWTLPAALYLFLFWRETPSYEWLWGIWLVLTLQLMESPFLFYVEIFTLGLMYASQPFKPSRQQLTLLLLGGFVWLWLSLPYWQLTREFVEAKRDIRDAAHNGLSLDEMFSKYHIQYLGMALFIGLASLGRKARTWLRLMLAGIILSLGPVLKLSGQTVKLLSLPLPLPYAGLYYLVPGFQGFRTPSRWIVLATLAASVIIALWLGRFKSRATGIFIALVLLGLVLAETPLFPGVTVNPQPPPVYAQIRALPLDAVILELPVKLWTMPNHELESLRSLYSLEHQRRRFNGYSGFAPQAWIELVQLLDRDGLTPALAERLHGLGVTHVVADNRLLSLTAFIDQNQSQRMPQN